MTEDLVLARSAQWVLGPLPEPMPQDDAPPTLVALPLDAEELRAAFGRMQAALGSRIRHRASLQVAVQELGMSAPAGWWSRAVSAGGAGAVAHHTFDDVFLEALRARGCAVGIHSDEAARALNLQHPLGPVLSDSESVRFAKRERSDLAVVGTVKIFDPAPLELPGGMVQRKAQVTLKVIASHTGDVLGAITAAFGDVSTLDASAEAAQVKALRQAADGAAERLWARVLEHQLEGDAPAP